MRSNLLPAARRFKVPRAAIVDRRKVVVSVKPRHCKIMDQACVAQIDFLGFAQLLLRSRGQAARFVRAFYRDTELHARLGARTSGDDDEPTIALFQYADTLTVVARHPGAAGIAPVVRATAFILASCHGRGLAARAGVSVGELWAFSRRPRGGLDGDFASGPAVAAAHLVESSQEWAGGALDPSVPWRKDYPEELRGLEDDGWLVVHKVPWKTLTGVRPKTALAINWTQALRAPSGGMHDLLDVAGSIPANPTRRRAWEKRGAAAQFFKLHGRPPVSGLGFFDLRVLLMTHSGNHLRLHPVQIKPRRIQRIRPGGAA